MRSSTRQRARVTEVDAMDDQRWDAYVGAHPDATAYHLAAWTRIVGAAYGSRACYLALVDDGGDRLRGVLPLFRARGLLSGTRLTSMPIARTAGPLGDTVGDEVALLQAARLRLAATGAARAVVRSTREGYERDAPEWSSAPDQPTWRTALPDDRDALFARLRKRSSNVARGIRRAQSAGVSVREATSEHDLRRFYALYLLTMRRHRALPRTLGQLLAARAALGPAGVFRLFLAEHRGDAVAGGVFHAFNGTLELLYNGSDDARLDVRPNHALYWHAMGWAIDHGLRCLDFGGGGEGTSLAAFKRRWGAEPTLIHRYTAHAGGLGSGPPADGAGPAAMGADDDGRVARAWRRMPLALTRAGGAIAYRYL